MDDIASNVGDVAAATEIDFSLLSGANATFIAEMNKAWRENPLSVDPHWAAYFEQLGKAGDFGADVEAGPSWGRPQSRVVGAVDADASIKAVAQAHGTGHKINAVDMRAATLDSLRAV